MITLCFTVILIALFTSLIYADNGPQLQLQGVNMTLDVESVGEIFYTDPDNNILLIDFKEINSTLLKIQIVKETTILLDDTVDDLSKDSIYEVDLNTYVRGAYIITLVTDTEDITKEFFIK
ncbi:MAG: hypothetical protein AAF960_26450 [Bacteroidota bacterium]